MSEALGTFNADWKGSVLPCGSWPLAFQGAYIPCGGLHLKEKGVSK